MCNGEYRKGLYGWGKPAFSLTAEQPLRPLTVPKNSKLDWNCHQPLAQLTEHNTIQLLQVTGHMETEGNETADKLDRKRFSHLFTGPQPALGTCGKTARRVIRGWMRRKQ
jgi:hypothetical protein